MNILELEKFKIEDAINFHDEYNPLLFDGDKLKPVIKRQLDIITNDFIEYMGIPDLAVEDVIITGSNVAYTYTPHSDIDLHLLVDFAKLPNSDVYKELFNAKKSLYNDTYDITIRDIPVELYVQDTAQAHTSLGEYSLYKDEFTRIPTKKRANLDEISAEAKFERLEELCIEGLKTKDLDKVNEVLSIIKRYRQAGLDTKGEFGPENLAFKAIRSKGYFQALFDLRNKLRAQQLSIEEEFLRRTFEESIGLIREGEKLSKPTPTVDDLSMDYDVSKETVLKQLDSGIKIELEHTNDREIAREIALDHLSEKLDYYELLAKFEKDNMSESLRYDLDQEYDEYGMPDYTKYLNAISRIVRYTKSKGEIIQRLLKQFPNIDKRDGKMLIQRWEVVKSHSKKDKETLVSEEKQYALYVDGNPLVRDSSRAEIEKHIAFLKSKGHKGEYEIKYVDFTPKRTSTTIGEASGYIPTEAERNDPRFSRALSVDVHPDTMKKQAKAMGLGNIARDGRPPLLRPGKATTKKKSNPNKDFGKGVY